MPEVGFGLRVPGPVGFFRIKKNNSGTRIFLIIVRPDVEIAFRRTGWRAPCALKPGMLVGRVIDYQFGNNAQPSFMRLIDKSAHIIDVAVIRMHTVVIRNIIAVITQRTWIKRQQPNGGHTERGDIVKLFDQSRKIADAVIIGIKK